LEGRFLRPGSLTSDLGFNLDPSTPRDRNDVVGSVLDVANPGAVGAHGDDLIMWVAIFTCSNEVADLEEWRRFAPIIG
jgi:hypothetical protein